jgi:large subunit ribosomal protein L1
MAARLVHGLKGPGEELTPAQRQRLQDNLKKAVDSGGVDGEIQRTKAEIAKIETALGKDKKATRKLVTEYDYFIAEAPLMPLVGKTIGPILGPRGKMPTPVPPNAPIDQIVNSHRKLIRVRVRDQPVVQCRIGTEKMPDEKIAENALAVFSRVEAKLERGAKNIRQVLVKTTMGKPVKVQIGKG